LFPEGPIDAARGRHHGAHLSTQLLLERWPPRHELESLPLNCLNSSQGIEFTCNILPEAVKARTGLRHISMLLILKGK
jgi:hypothetical protein